MKYEKWISLKYIFVHFYMYPFILCIYVYVYPNISYCGSVCYSEVLRREILCGHCILTMLSTEENFELNSKEEEKSFFLDFEHHLIFSLLNIPPLLSSQSSCHSHSRFSTFRWKFDSEDKISQKSCRLKYVGFRPPYKILTSFNRVYLIIRFKMYTYKIGKCSRYIMYTKMKNRKIESTKTAIWSTSCWFRWCQNGD